LQADTTYYILLAPEDEARNVFPPDLDPTARLGGTPPNETSITTPATCASTCGPLVFGGWSLAVPGDCEIAFTWEAARGEAPLEYDVLREGTPVATGLSGTTWTDTTVPWSSGGISYSIVARDSCADPGPREVTGRVFGSRPDDYTPPDIEAPALTQSAPCRVRVEVVLTDSCSGPDEWFRVDRDGSARTFTTRLPYDDPVPGDGTYTYRVRGSDQANNEAWSPPSQITVSGCVSPSRCLYRAWSWDRDSSDVFRDPRAPNDIAFEWPRDVPIDPCPFPSGETVGHRDLELVAPDLIFYQLEGADLLDMRVVADPGRMSVRILH
jgi:hypothetical protein